jgi:hypothetical protein
MLMHEYSEKFNSGAVHGFLQSWYNLGIWIKGICPNSLGIYESSQIPSTQGFELNS